MKQYYLRTFLIALSLLVFSSKASSTLVTPQERVEVLFSMPPVTRPSLHPSDTVVLAFKGNASVTSATAFLFDDSLLLGINEVSLVQSSLPSVFLFYWTDYTSHFVSSNSTTEGDLSSVIDRTIQGRINVFFDGVFDFTSVNLIVGNGTYSGSIGIEGGNYVIVDSVSVKPISSVPLPGSLFLFVSGLLGVVGLRRKVTPEASQ